MNKTNKKIEPLRVTRLEDLPELAHESEVCAFLRKSPTTMWRLRNDHLISFRRHGGVYYTHDDIREYLERIKCVAAAA